MEPVQQDTDRHFGIPGHPFASVQRGRDTIKPLSTTAMTGTASGVDAFTCGQNPLGLLIQLFRNGMNLTLIRSDSVQSRHQFATNTVLLDCPAMLRLQQISKSPFTPVDAGESHLMKSLIVPISLQYRCHQSESADFGRFTQRSEQLDLDIGSLLLFSQHRKPLQHTVRAGAE